MRFQEVFTYQFVQSTARGHDDHVEIGLLDVFLARDRAPDAGRENGLAVSLDEGVGDISRELNPFGAIHVCPRARVATRNAN